LPKGATTVDPQTGETIRSPQDSGRREDDSGDPGSQGDRP
jgi:hypothetical protein